MAQLLVRSNWASCSRAKAQVRSSPDLSLTRPLRYPTAAIARGGEGEWGPVLLVLRPGGRPQSKVPLQFLLFLQPRRARGSCSELSLTAHRFCSSLRPAWPPACRQDFSSELALTGRQDVRLTSKCSIFKNSFVVHVSYCWPSVYVYLISFAFLLVQRTATSFKSIHSVMAPLYTDYY